MKRLLRVTSLSLVLLSVIGGFALAQEDNASLPIGTEAPAFNMLDLHGKQVSLESFRGKTVLLNFWAFWCNTWEQEMPQLRELAARQEDLGFRLLAISVDGTRLREFAGHTDAGIPFPVLLDIGGRLTSLYKVGHVPTVLILDGQGVVRYSSIAWPGNQVILNHLRKLSTPKPTAIALPATGFETRNLPAKKRRRPVRRRH